MKRLNKHVRLLLVLMLTLAMLMSTAVTASARGKADSDPPTTEATEPAEKETEGAKGRDSEESDAEKEKSDSEEDEDEDGKDEEETNVILIIAIAAAAAAAAAGTVVLLQKRKRNQDSGYNSYSGEFSGGYAGGGYSGGGYSGGMVEEDKPTDIWNPNSAPAFDVQIPNNIGMQQSAQAYVCFESGALAGKRYPLGAKITSVGRDPAADISFPPETRGVSRRHCQLFVKNGTVMVVDVGSSSGTFVSSKGRIPPNTPVPLQPQDTVYLGGKHEIFRIKQ